MLLMFPIFEILFKKNGEFFKLQNKIEPILKSDFTTKIPDSLKSIDSPHSRYTIYYSKKL